MRKKDSARKAAEFRKNVIFMMRQGHSVSHISKTLGKSYCHTKRIYEQEKIQAIELIALQTNKTTR
jgi:cytochrome c-type biogenesis protein CcmH/NrfF